MENNEIMPGQKAYNIYFASHEMVRFKVEPLAAARLSRELSIYLADEILKETDKKDYWKEVKEHLNRYGK